MASTVVGPSGPPIGTPGYVSGFLGGVAADEPRAALAGRDVLSAGGNAMDAAVATGFALAVTYPSRAGLGGGGACLALMPATESPGMGKPDAVLFVPPAPAAAGTGDRPAAVPLLARGLFALHARYGRRPFESLIVPAEQMARFGAPASRAFVRDLALVAGPLAADPPAAAVFFQNGRPLAEGANLVQPDLAATLTQLRTAGVGDLYQGGLARRLVDAAPAAGASFTLADLRAALPRVVPPLDMSVGRDRVAFLPPPADGGLATAAAFQALRADADPASAGVRALGIATEWRRGGGDPAALLAAQAPAPALPPLPASTTFATLDRDGNAVVCAVTMNNLFGTGRIAAGTGIVLAASPAAVPPPLLSAALAWNGNLHAFRAVVGGSGQEAAPLAAAFGLAQVLGVSGNAPLQVPPPEPGRVNAIACGRYLPGETGTCGWVTDPRGSGLAIGSN